MKYVFLITIALAGIINKEVFSQTTISPKQYAHKVIVQEVIQTKNYTYLYVKEHLSNMDSLQWMALPSIEAKIGDVYYYENGLQMGEFQSKELNRTFNQILFIGSLSTNPEVSSKNLVPAVPVAFEDSSRKNIAPAEIHTVVVEEVIQTSGYTYMRVKEDGKEEWIAIVKIPAKVGQVYTYDDAAKMTNFTSKELNRTFKEVLFISSLKLSTNSGNNEMMSAHSHNSVSGVEVKGQKGQEENNIIPGEGEISIAQLIKNKKSYAGKAVRIRGEVTKYSADILNKNWIHMEDATSFTSKSDLTITTNQTAKVGDVIVVEGLISLDKDFGSGYFFDVIMEEAKLEKK